nr:S8 family serine peptidase [Solirubrobacterales bacterium]
DGLGDDVDAAGEYPCAYDLANVVCVAASDRNDQLASFSNYGATRVDLTAPGVDILSDQPPSSTGAPRYAFYNGTSMATPHVSGVAALALALSPGASVGRVKQALLDGTVARTSLSGRTVTGGRLDARRALELLSDAPPAAPASSTDPSTTSPAPTTTSPTPTTTSPAPTTTTEPPPPPAGPEPTAAPTVQSPVPRDTAAPVASLLLGARHRVRTVRRLGLRTRATCLEACTATAVLSLSPRNAKRARVGSRLRTVTIGRGRRRLLSTASTMLTVRLTSTAGRALKRLARPVRATLAVTFVDAAGNRRTLRKSVTLVGGAGRR